MKIFIAVLILFSTCAHAQNAWINEFHYDNTGSSDEGEFVEVAIENAGSFDLSDFRISFYSSTSGSRYDNYHGLDTFTEGITDNNITLYFKLIPGIQNGPNDGIALDYNSSVLQFISYEGVLTASEGVASGSTSVDVGVSETSSTPVGYSIGLSGSGTNYNNFTWEINSDDSPGQENDNQALPVELISFSIEVVSKKVNIRWETATEINNYGFEIQRFFISPNLLNGNEIIIPENDEEWAIVGFIKGYGNSNSIKNYNFIDTKIQSAGRYYYRLKQIDFDGRYEYSDRIEVNLSLPAKIQLNQNHPNPFNPTTNIQFNLPLNAYVNLSVFNILGEKVTELLNGEIPAGYHNVVFDASDLISGIYFYKLEANNFSKVRKMMLVK